MVKKIKLDFSKVEDRASWNSKQMPEGMYAVKVESVDDTPASDGTDMWTFALVPQDKRYAMRRFPFYCKLQPNQLWKVRDLFVAAGIDVPKKAQFLDPNKVVGKVIAAEITDGTGQYSERSEINGVYALSVIGEDSAEDEGPEDDEDEEYDEEVDEDEDIDDEEEPEEDELETMTLPELRKLAKELGIKTVGLKQDAIIEAIQEAQDEAEDEEDEDEDDLDDEDLEDDDLTDEELEDDEEDEEEEEPAPAPARRKAPARKPAAKAAAPARRSVRRR